MRTVSGLVLLVVVGVLGILALLAAAFVTMAQLERRASQQRLHAAQATLLARSGLEDAMARLASGQDPEAATNAYAGEDWNADGLLNGPEIAGESFRRGTLDVEDCPVQHALRPSFFMADSLGKPLLSPVDGHLRGGSGRLQDGLYSLKASSGGLYVNGGDLSAGDFDFDGIPNARDTGYPSSYTDGNGNPHNFTYLTYNAMLRRMLGTLAEAIDRQDASNDGLPVDQTDGERLIDVRPTGGWQSWSQIRDLALGGSQTRLDVLRPYLTLRAWVDLKVIHPNPPLDPDGWNYLSQGDIRKRQISQGFLVTAPGFENVPEWGRTWGRSPVDLAWARRHRPVLIALLAGLRGCWLDPSSAAPGMNRGAPFTIGNTASVRLDLPAGWTPTTPCDCLDAADRILTSTSELFTWAQWDAFCDTLPFTGTSDETQAKRDLLKANFNPNSDLNKFNPNPSLWRSVDKCDLLAYSTEFSLTPMSEHALACIGRVLGRDGRLLAARTLEATLSGPSLFRMTTQKEFVCEDLGRLDLAGDEKDLRLPGFRRPGASEFLTQSQGEGRTWGHRLDVSDLYPGTWMAGDCRGASLQTYPEPYVDLRPTWPYAIRAADWDGNLQRATIETREDPPTLGFLARYTAGLDLDVTAGGDRDCEGDGNMFSQMATGYALQQGLFNRSQPVSLYPDGYYAEWGKAPAYNDRGSANGKHGVISFWIKPSWGKIEDMNVHSFVRWTNFAEPSWQYDIGTDTGVNQFFFLGAAEMIYSGVDFARGFVGQFETGHEPSDADHEHRFLTPPRTAPARRWSLLTFYYDFEAPNGNECGELLVDDGKRATDKGSSDTYSTSTFNDLTGVADITADFFDGWHRITLGGRMDNVNLSYSREDCDGGSGYWSWTPQWQSSAADATLDEFAIYDFGRNESSAAALAATRFTEGRYYKGATYTFLNEPHGDIAPGWFSAPIRLPKGSRLIKVAWTWYRPAELPDDYAEIELVNPDGAGYLGEGYTPGSALSRSTLAKGFSADRQDWDLARDLDMPFRAHVVFRRRDGVTLDPNTPMLDSPILDDLGFYTTPREGSRILSWGTP